MNVSSVIGISGSGNLCYTEKKYLAGKNLVLLKSNHTKNLGIIRVPYATKFDLKRIKNKNSVSF